MTQENSRSFKPGDKVKHFKQEKFSEEERNAGWYTYEIICFAEDTSSGVLSVIYKALYGNQKIWSRPYSEFVSEVDHKKYPKIKQKYRFEKI